MQELRALVVAGPDPATHEVVRFRCIDLRDEVSQRFGVVVSRIAVSDALLVADFDGLPSSASRIL